MPSSRTLNSQFLGFIVFLLSNLISSDTSKIKPTMEALISPLSSFECRTMLLVENQAQLEFQSGKLFID